MREEYYDCVEQKRKGIGIAPFIFAVIIAMLVGAFAMYLYFDKEYVRTDNSGSVYNTDNIDSTVTATPSASANNTDITDAESIFENIYINNRNSTVKIISYAEVNGISEKYGSASGFIYSKDGYIITNNHVLENADKITVTLYSGETYEATEIGRDERSEVAVIKINSKVELAPVVLGNSDNIKVGQYAIAIGNPLGYDFTMSVGHISGVNRIVDSNNFRFEMIQIDTAINSGNSGGPLFNIKGEVIGINTLKESNTSSSATVEGMGFAIPINTAKKIADELIQNGKVTRAALNATVGNKIENGEYIGVYISELTPNGAAEIGGLKVGDVICEFNGTPISVMNELMEQLDKCNPNERVKIKILRNGEEITLNIILGST